MYDSNEVHLRHSSHYLNVLSEAVRAHITKGLQVFDLEWPNIELAYQWVSKYARFNEEAARLTIAYATCQFDLLHLRLHPQQQIRWIEKSLHLSQQYIDHDAKGVLLNNLGLALARLGRLKEAIANY